MFKVSRQSSLYWGLGLAGLVLVLAFVVLYPSAAQAALADFPWHFDLTQGEASFAQQAASYGLTNYAINIDGCIPETGGPPCGFVDGVGFRLGMQGGLRMPIPEAVPIGHVAYQVKAKGFDVDMTIFDVYGWSDAKDGRYFSMWRDWCEDYVPCDGSEEDAQAQECYENNWGTTLQKAPPMDNFASNTMQLKGYLGDGVLGRFHDWDPDTLYTISVSADAADGGGMFEVSDVGSTWINYQMPNYNDRSGVVIRLGSENEGGVRMSYGGVVITEFTIEAMEARTEEEIGDNYGPPDHPCSDDPDPNTDDPDNPYDTCSCHGMPDLLPIPCEDPIDKRDPDEPRGLSPFPFEFDGLDLKWNWTLDKVKEEFNAKEDDAFSEPEILMIFATPAPLEGTPAQITSASYYYSSKPNNMYYSWCLADESVGSVWPANAVVAGGTWPELTLPDLTWAEGACCQPITRRPWNMDIVKSIKKSRSYC